MTKKNKTIKLYRGISVDSDKLELTREEILKNGITEKSVGQNYNFHGEQYTYFADYEGAIFYATQHHTTVQKGIIVEAIFEINEIIIDGRDLLKPVIELYNNKDPLDSNSKNLSLIFGDEILKYYNSHLAQMSLDERYLVYENAITNDSIILNHLKNTHLINGRSNVKFKSAFMVKKPILPCQIIKVHIVEPNTQKTTAIELAAFFKK